MTMRIMSPTSSNPPFEVKCADGVWRVVKDMYIMRSDGFGGRVWVRAASVYEATLSHFPNPPTWEYRAETSKYHPVTGEQPTSVTAIAKTGAHNNYEAHFTWNNPVAPAGDVWIFVHNMDDSSFDILTNLGTQGSGAQTTSSATYGNAVGQRVYADVFYKDSAGFFGPSVSSNVVTLDFFP